jgi:hypothetical protein
MTKIYRAHRDHTTLKYSDKIDHIYIAFLECRATGPWNTSGSDDLLYISQDDNAEVNLVELNGTRKRIVFKKGAYITILSSNVITTKMKIQ